MPVLDDLPDPADEPYPALEPPLEWRERVRAALDAAQIPPAAAVGVVVLVAAAIAGAAWLNRTGDTTPVEATLPFASTTSVAPTTTTAPVLVVHVAGAVRRPGVYSLAAGARAIDAVDEAGGATDDADLARVNLAAVLVDGARLYIPHLGEVDPPPPLTAEVGPGADGDDRPVDLNTATQADLESLPGVGPSIASAILAHRDEHGPFRTVDDLLAVPGIGEVRLANLRDLVTV